MAAASKIEYEDLEKFNLESPMKLHDPRHPLSHTQHTQTQTNPNLNPFPHTPPHTHPSLPTTHLDSRLKFSRLEALVFKINSFSF